MYKVLIVDDEPIVKIALKSIINWEEFGYTIIATASDGVEALQCVEKDSPDLVITDLKMPKMNGLDLIKELNNRGFMGEILVISNYDDFDSVRSALVQGAANYILKVSIEAEPLKDILSDITQRLLKKQNSTQNSLRSGQTTIKDPTAEKKLFLNRFKDYLEADEYPDKSLQELNEGSYLSFPSSFGLVHLKNKDDGKVDSHLLYDIIFESLNDLPEKEIVFISPSLIMVIFPINDGNTANAKLVEPIFTKLSQALSLYVSLESDVVFGIDIKDPVQFKNVYKQAKLLLDFCFYNPLGVINAAAFTPQHYMDFAYYKDFASEIQRYNNNKLEHTYMRIDEIISLCAQRHVYPEILLKFFVKTLDMLEYLNPSHSAETHDYLDEQKENILSVASSKDLYDIMADSCSAIFAPITGLSVDNANNIRQDVKSAISYISKNCYHKISLDEISSHVGISPSYLSKIFKAETGLNITGYITKLKMEKAASLIKAASSDTYLKEIALQVGIEDQLYFSRIFKKYYGISPSEYKSEN